MAKNETQMSMQALQSRCLLKNIDASYVGIFVVAAKVENIFKKCFYYLLIVV
jgi:hypothetical protein